MFIQKFNTYSKYIKELFLFSIPMIIGNLGHILINLGDVVVAARHGADTFAAVSIGAAISVTIFIFGIGLLSSISPILSNLRGEGANVKSYFLQTISFSMLFALFFCLLTIFASSFIEKIGFAPYLVPVIKNFVFICSFSIFGAYLHFGLKEFLQSMEITMVPNMISFAFILVTIFLNIVLAFGYFGFPEMGATGIAISTVIGRTLMGLSLLIYSLKFFKEKQIFYKNYGKQIMKVGTPIAFSIFLEFLGFNVITIIFGKVSPILAASHNLVLNLSTTTFMIPLAISNAIGIKVGYYNGAKNYIEMKRYAIAGVLMTLVFMSACTIAYVVYPGFFIGLFTSDKELMKICTKLLLVAGIFQIFDGAQVAQGGILKGLKSTRTVLVSIILGYWLVGLPLGLTLAFKFNLSLFGYWIGLAISLFVMSLFLFVILMRKFSILKKRYTVIEPALIEPALT